MNGIYEEKVLRPRSGFAMLALGLMAYALGIALVIFGGITLDGDGNSTLGILLLVLGILIILFGWVPMLGLKIVKPQEAIVLTLFGQYYGTIRHNGFFYVHPFTARFNPAAGGPEGVDESGSAMIQASKDGENIKIKAPLSKAISLKVMTLNNNKQKINDKLGNPVEIGVVVIWRVVNTAKAVFNVDNFITYLSIQCDSALRNIARLYPYDTAEDGEEMTLRGSSSEVAEKLKNELQGSVEIAGLEIIEARITHLAYAPEIAAAMLQRQQASAVVDARMIIVDGAVGMVEMALEKLAQNDVVHLDEERKARMVANLMVVLCGNRDVQPIVNSGSIY